MLFQQILRSEQKAEDRRTEIALVNNEILETERKIKELRSIINSAKLQLKEEKAKVLFDEQAELEVLTKQSDSLLQQRTKLKKNLEFLKFTHKENTKKFDEEFNDFLEKIDDFVETYSLTNSKTKNFQRQQLDELKKLKQEEKIEEQRLEEAKKQEENVSAISEHHACLEAEVSHLRATIIELDSQLEEKRKIVEEKKVELESVPSAIFEPEYCRLQNELQSMDSRATEAEVVRLRREPALLQSRK